MTNNNMTNENIGNDDEMKIDVPWGGPKTIKDVAQQAIHWASGSWGQGEYDNPRYNDKTMGYIWAEVARIAKQNSDRHFDKAIEAKANRS
jgi:hypothetical protein